MQSTRFDGLEGSTADTGASPWDDEETRLRMGLCRVGRLAYQRGLITGSEGNLSARKRDGTLLITPSGAMKGFLEPRHIAHVDRRGNALDGARGSTEIRIHLTAYEERSDVHAVVHTHPPHAVALSIAEIDQTLPVLPETVVTTGGTPTAPYATPGTEELPDSIREIVRCSDTVILKNHGALTMGSNLMDAYKKVEMLEHTARILWLAHVVRGGIDPLPPEAAPPLSLSLSDHDRSVRRPVQGEPMGGRIR